MNFIPKWRNSVAATRPTYKSWRAMLERCYSEGNASYPRYGARGISVCERWRNSYDDFVLDMGFRPEGMTLDRIENDGNYEPGNVRWATKKQQDRNRRYHRRVDGMTVAELAETSGISKSLLTYRLNHEYSKSDLLKPPNKPKHGTVSKYAMGCRCQPCIKSNKDYQRKYRLRHDPLAGVDYGWMG